MDSRAWLFTRLLKISRLLKIGSLAAGLLFAAPSLAQEVTYRYYDDESVEVAPLTEEEAALTDTIPVAAPPAGDCDPRACK